MERKNVLFLDEEKWFTNLYLEYSKSEPFKIIVANTPKEFFEKINDQMCYDLFILDIMIPLSLFDNEDLNHLTRPQKQLLEGGLNVGIVFYDILRKIPKYKNIPVIFYTAKADPEIADDPYYWYISKPVTWPVLFNQIKKHL